MRNRVHAIQQELSNASIAMKGELIETAMADLLGPYNGNVVIYDHMKRELRPETYHGEKLTWFNEDIRNAASAKGYIDLSRPCLTVYRTLCMQVAEEDYPGFAKWTPSGKILTPTADGTCTVCNYVLWNEATGRYELLRADSWLGASDLGFPDNAARNGAQLVALFGACFWEFQAAVCNAARVR